MEPSTARSRAGRRAAPLSAPGVAVASVLFTLTLGPSLTPPGPLVQGAAAGLMACLGYGLGVLVGAIAGSLGLGGPATAARRRRVRRVTALVASFLGLTGLWWSARWQDALRRRTGAGPTPVVHDALTTLAVALLLLLTMLSIVRGLRLVTRRLAQALRRRHPPRRATLLATTTSVLVTALMLGGLGQLGRVWLDRRFEALDRQTFAGSVQPTSPERSGSTGSTSPWASLGREGRRFVSTGPTRAQISAFDARIGLDRPALEPIRVYAGRSSSQSLDLVAARVVAELDRTRAWDRAVLVVATTTGTGWVDPAAARAIELVSGGDCAIAAMQFSTRPSWVSFVGERGTPADAGRALYDAVHARWLALPVDHRPRLYVTGISLGAYGSQAAFGSLDDVLTGTDGAVWAGTPSFTPLWQQLTAARDPGSPQVAPVLADGSHVRWVATGEDVARPGTAWTGPRVVYLQHPSDAVVWWSGSLVVDPGDWGREPPGADVPADLHWLPLVSFVQVTADLMVAGHAPPGHGHSYRGEYAGAWAAVLQVPGWTAADTAAVRAALDAR